MKRFGLSSQIWLLFAVVLLSLFIILSVVFRWSIREFFTDEVYQTIEYAQTIKLTEFQGGAVMIRNFDLSDLRSIRDVGHVIILDNQFGLLEELYRSLKPSSTNAGVEGAKSEKGSSQTDPAITEVPISGTLPPDIIPMLEKILHNAQTQVEATKRYQINTGRRMLFYVVQSTQVVGRDMTVISYMWDTYKNRLTETLFSKIFLVMVFAALLSLLAAVLFSRYLTKPLKKLSGDVLSIAARDWNKSISIDRKDEIGELANAMEMMRKSLSEQDKEQQAMLQFISHELKTPVMVIRSYSQAIKDGIYPGGSLDSTIDVIDREIQRMERRVRDLLFITRLEHLSRHNLETEEVEIAELIEDTVSRLSYQREDVDWELSLKELALNVNEDQLSIAIENILTNQIRYAHNLIEIEMGLSIENSTLIIKFKNNGPLLEEEKLAELFEPFTKGKGGENGLGLHITKRIIELHGGKVWLENVGGDEPGVSTCIELPLT